MVLAALSGKFCVRGMPAPLLQVSPTFGPLCGIVEKFKSTFGLLSHRPPRNSFPVHQKLFKAELVGFSRASSDKMGMKRYFGNAIVSPGRNFLHDGSSRTGLTPFLRCL
jgi:hypothetical protein